MKDNFLRICLVLLVVFLLSFPLTREIKRETHNREIWVVVFKEINRWDLDGDQIYWESWDFEPDEGRTLFIECSDDWHDTSFITHNGSYVRSDTFYFISADLEDTSWIVNDTSWVFEDTSGADILLTPKEYRAKMRREGIKETLWIDTNTTHIKIIR